MKIRAIWHLFVLSLVTALIIAVYRSPVNADPASGADQIVLLPLIGTAPLPPTIKLVPFASGFTTDTITGIVSAGDDRLFVAERTGVIRIVQKDGQVLSDPFLDLRSEVKTSNWELGLLGLAFHPDFPAVPYFFVTYTPETHDIRVSRFSVNPADPNEAMKSSEVVLIHLSKHGKKKNADYRVHNAGDLHFGPDGYLYIAIGDGGPDPWDSNTEGDPDNRGQYNGDLLANILRVDVDASGGLAPDCGEGNYTVPRDNPLVDGAHGDCDEVWAYGLRNPYRFSFDRLTGDMYIGEVGEDRWEEVNFQPAHSPGGQNYGWACIEGTTDYRRDDPNICPPGTIFTPPMHEYDQSNYDCSIIGGYVYRGLKFPTLYGRYLFGDFCTGRLWLLNPNGRGAWTKTAAGSTKLFISTFGEDTAGELYLGHYNHDGWPEIYRLEAVP